MLYERGHCNAKGSPYGTGEISSEMINNRRSVINTMIVKAVKIIFMMNLLKCVSWKLQKVVCKVSDPFKV